MTDLDLQALKRQLALAPLSITCPSCGSGPGKDCYGNGPMPYYHAQRTLSALPISITLALIARIDNLEATIQRVRDLHVRETLAVHEGYGPEAWCNHCREYWPCRDIQALEGDPA